MSKLHLALTLGIVLYLSAGCAAQRKPDLNLHNEFQGLPSHPSPPMPPNTNRSPLPRSPQYMARGLAGTAQRTPGVDKAWGVAFERTLLLGVYLTPGLPAQEAQQVKLDAVARTIDATTQSIVIKITDDPQLVERIKYLAQQMQKGHATREYLPELKRLSKSIPSIDPERPR